MATIAEAVGYVIIVFALLNTLLHIISYLSDGEFHENLWTWIKDKLRDLTVAAPAAVPNHVTHVNNQMYYNYTFTQPCTFTLGNGQAPEFNQIQGHRRGQIEAAPDADDSPIAVSQLYRDIDFAISQLKRDISFG